MEPSKLLENGSFFMEDSIFEESPFFKDLILELCSLMLVTSDLSILYWLGFSGKSSFKW